MSLAKRGVPLEEHIKTCFDPRMVAGTKDELVLPDQPVDLSATPDKILLILFASRSGSTYAGQLLSNTPYFDRVAESFNPAQLNLFQARKDHADHGETLRWFIAERGTPQAFAAKCGEPGLISAWHLGFLDAFIDRITFTMLERRDRVAQAVSLFRAQLSGRFHSAREEKTVVTDEHYDRGKIAELMTVIERVYGAMHRFLDLSGKTYRTVYYEDICADPETFVRDTCADLGLALPGEISSEVRNQIMRDALSAAWVERFNAGR